MADKGSSGLQWFSPTFMRPWLALAAVAAFSFGALEWSVRAQAPAAKDINPPVANCPNSEDTVQDPSQADPKKRIARKIGPELLTTGLPCAQTASGLGLLRTSSSAREPGRVFLYLPPRTSEMLRQRGTICVFDRKSHLFLSEF